MLDLVLDNERVAGTGNPCFFGDVGIKDGVIGSVDRSLEGSEQANQVVSPNLIDCHCHSDLMILDRPGSEVKVHRGITSEVLGTCGIARAALRREPPCAAGLRGARSGPCEQGVVLADHRSVHGDRSWSTRDLALLIGWRSD